MKIEFAPKLANERRLYTVSFATYEELAADSGGAQTVTATAEKYHGEEGAPPLVIVSATLDWPHVQLLVEGGIVGDLWKIFITVASVTGSAPSKTRVGYIACL